MTVLAGAAAVAGAQDGGPDPFPELVERLGSASWVEREQATETIGTSDAFGLDQIEAALRRDDLSGEQRARLERAAVNRFRFEPLGGLGVSFGQASEGAVRIASVVEGFPAAAVLRVGDLITSVGGQIIRSQDHLRAEILSRRPGESLPVMVRRGAGVVELDLPLGEYANLQDAAALDDETVRQALALRRTREGVARATVDWVGSGIDAELWLEAAFEGAETMAGDGDRRGPTVMPGGSVRAMELTRRRRSYWKDLADAMTDTAKRLHTTLQRRMTTGLLMRGVYLDYGRTLGEEIAKAEAAGEPTGALEARRAEVAAALAAVDATLSETAQEIDRISPSLP